MVYNTSTSSICWGSESNDITNFTWITGQEGIFFFKVVITTLPALPDYFFPENLDSVPQDLPYLVVDENTMVDQNTMMVVKIKIINYHGVGPCSVTTVVEDSNIRAPPFPPSPLPKKLTLENNTFSF